ncbi:phosphatase PAP2 family protein [Glutamicibacter uratoxydans]|uniref:Phosphatase PAP2 family protein n=1 Tax=Glutamicibacter uratoxydans TaxID=43667 RepID=A0A4Y4DMA7_GLUUR|nr:phosphatase PAP2 family protein [Glutamicibacter uratoxydans]GED06452.1 phosphatase PAP2 family protein [Glutamicibacter uratoxydans]
MNSESVPRTRLKLSTSFNVVLCLVVLALISFAFKDQLYTAIDTTVQSSAVLSALAVFCSEPLLVLLVLSAAGIAAWSWFKDRSIFWTIAASGMGVVAAYVVSTVLKLLVTEQRPCQSIHVATALACPPAGDWSWPSNHSVIAGAFATACILALPKLRWYFASAAALVALSRVGVGAHYLHDALTGLAVGILVVVISTAVVRPLLVKYLPSKFVLGA